MRTLYLVAAALLLAGCSTTADFTAEDCEALCTRQGLKVHEYRVGVPFPIFRPVPPAICRCG